MERRQCALEDLVAVMFNVFYRGRRVLVTGHAGFKGSWLCLLLHHLGTQIFGYSLLPDSSPRLYEICSIPKLLAGEKIADIRDSEALRRFVQQTEPEIILHLAAQPLVIESYHDPVGTYTTNVIGTLNVLEAARSCPSVKAFVNVTTDKCYENKEDGRAYREDDAFGGYDMYSSSKACSEILTASYRRSFLSKEDTFRLASARAGNVIGGGDFSANRLLVDCVKALSRNEKIEIRHPAATRPWQLVLEPLAAYLTLAKHLYEGDEACLGGFNFGPNPKQVLPVIEVVKLAIEAWGHGAVKVNEQDAFHEAGALSLNIDKAEKLLGIRPVYNAQRAVAETVSWYRTYFEESADMQQFSFEQIDRFSGEAAELGLSWSA